jgi:uncharacterized damage-inducible protein DinB
VGILVEVKKLLEYNETVRHRYFDRLAKLSWEEFTANREASFNSMRSIFVHILAAIDYWLDFLQGQNLRERKNYDDYSTFEEVRAYMTKIDRRTDSYLERLSDEELHRTYSVKDDSGQTTSVTAEDILIHVFEEEVHHRGELIALLWQINVEPPLMGWKGL